MVVLATFDHFLRRRNMKTHNYYTCIAAGKKSKLQGLYKNTDNPSCLLTYVALATTSGTLLLLPFALVFGGNLGGG